MKRNKIISTIVIAILLSVSFSVNAETLQEKKHDPLILDKKIGIKVKTIKNLESTISLERIKDISRDIPEASQTTNIDYELVSATMPNFNMFSTDALEKNVKLKQNGYIKGLPVWLVSFKDINIPATTEGLIAHSEIVYVIDAMTGEKLMSFTYR